MLNIILGTNAKTATEFIISSITHLVKQHKKTMLIVPEQASFQTEKIIFERMPMASDCISVMSFSRIAEIILLKLGAENRKSLDESASAIMMSVALDEIADELTVYKKHSQSPSFIGQMISLEGECQNTGVSPEKLASFSLTQPEGALREKTFELSLIFDTYRAVIDRSFRSQSSMMDQAVKKLLATPDYFKDYYIYIDDFAGFTASQLLMIEVMLNQTEQVSISICTDEPHSKSPAFDVANLTISSLLKIASASGKSVHYEILKNENATLPPELFEMQRSAISCKLPKEGVSGSAVSARAFPTAYDELTATAAAISQMVRGKYRYRDISIIFRGLDRYKTLIPLIFERYNIPYFIDSPQDATSGALCFGLILAIKIAAGQGGDLCELAKAPIMGVDIQEAAELERYCYIWSLTTAQQMKPFLNHPDGLKEKMDDKAKLRLENIEATRKKLADSMLVLKDGMKSQNGNSFAESVMVFIESFSVKDNLIAFADSFEGTAREEFLEQQSLLWDQVVEILELFYSLSKEIALSRKRCSELFTLAVSRMKVATVPRTLDEVTITTADRMRSTDIKIAFILGAILGEFPAVLEASGILSDSERQILRNDGLALSDSQYADAHERMICYRAVGTPTELLLVSYPKTSGNGEVLSPSPIYDRAMMLSKKAEDLPLSLLQTKQSALWQLSATASENTVEQASVLSLCQDVFGDRETKRIKNASVKPKHVLKDKKISKRLFGDKIRLSPSKLEQYYNCPFSYFMQSGLKIRAFKKAELSGLEAGALIHFILECMVKKHGGKGLSSLEKATIRSEVSILIDEYLKSRVDDTDDMSQRMKGAFIRIGKWITELLMHLAKELSQSSFEPVAFELSIREGSEVEPLHLTAADGTQITVEGTIDRVDVATIDGKRYVRVIDYKSGQKTFNLSDVYYGLNMQMLIYLFTVCKNGENDLNDLFPAGILYQPSLGKYHSVARGEKEEKLLSEKAKHYCMNGLILKDENVLKAMEVSGDGIFIPVKGTDTASNSLATLEEMGRLAKLVENRVSDMAVLLKEGKIEAIPMTSKNTSPCDYCDYIRVCGFEQGDEVKKAFSVDRDKLLREGKCDDEMDR